MARRRTKENFAAPMLEKSRSLRAEAILQQLQLLKHEQELLAVKEEVLNEHKAIFEQRKLEMARVFLNSVPCLVADIDCHQFFSFCNSFYAEFFGLPRNEIVGKRLWDVFKDRDYDAIRPSLVRALDGKEAVFDTYISGKRRRYVHGSVSPHRDYSGSITGVFLFLLDITERKALEDKQTRNAKKLRQLANERAELLRKAQEANKLKDTFLASLSHELRTPLSSIVGWSVLINSGKLSREQTAVGMNAIERNARIQTRLIEDLLDLSRMIAGKVELNLAQVDLAVLVRQEVESIRPFVNDKGINILTRTPAKAIPPVRADAGRIRQVIDNLLSNALKFTPCSGHITIDLNRTPADVQIVIKDDGPGIPEDVLPHIFEEFRQADMSSERSQSGLGLGLSIARRLIDLHHGSIQAENRRHGTAFVVRLPIP